MSGVPVVGARIGGVPGLVRDSIDGLLYEPFSVDALRACLQRLVDDRALVSALARALPAVKTIDADAEAWDGRYARLTSRRAAGATATA